MLALLATAALVILAPAPLVNNTSLSFFVPLAIVASVILLSLKTSHVRQDEKQTFTASFPALPKMNQKVSTLLIGRDDTEVIHFLQKHGKTVRNGETITVKYNGKQVYFPTFGCFRIKNHGYRPKTVHVDAVAGFDLMTWRP
jgi:hypothetical protein